MGRKIWIKSPEKQPKIAPPLPRFQGRELARLEPMSFLCTMVRRNPKGDADAYSCAPSPN